MPGPDIQPMTSRDALQPQVVRRHRDHDVVAQQRGQRGHVVALEGVDVPRRGAPRAPGRAWCRAGRRRAAARVARARCSALFTDATDVSSSSADLRGLPPEHLAEDQHRALARRQVLQGGDEGEADRLAGRRDVGRVAVEVDDPVVGDRLHERVLGLGREHGGGDRGRRAEVHRAGPALRAAVHVDAHVAGDAVEPRPHRRAALEAVDRLPGPDEASPAPRPRPRRPSRASGSRSR